MTQSCLVLPWIPESSGQTLLCEFERSDLLEPPAEEAEEERTCIKHILSK